MVSLGIIALLDVRRASRSSAGSFDSGRLGGSGACQVSVNTTHHFSVAHANHAPFEASERFSLIS